MLFVSYFDGLDGPSHWATDFDWFASVGIRGVRVFPNWWQPGNPGYVCDPNTVITLSGLNQTRLMALRNLITAAGQRGLVVEVALSRETVCGMPPYPTDPSPLQKAAYLAGVTELAQALAGYSNVIVDLQNEWNHVFPSWDGLDQVLAIRDAYLQGDSSKILVASMDQNGATATAVALVHVHGLGAVAYHDPRGAQWYSTELSSKIAALKQELWNNRFPIYLNEPRYWRDGEVTRQQFREAVRTAKAQGAAVWTFHTEQSFDLSSQSLTSRLTSSELTALQTLCAFEAADWGVVDAYPGGTTTATFAEGSTGFLYGQPFFKTEIALANPTATQAEAQLVYVRDDGLVVGTATTVSGQRRRTVTPSDQLLLQDKVFSTRVTSVAPVFADRYMMWDSRRYGTHLERSVGNPRESWYFAEGATIAGMDTFLLLSNPHGFAFNVMVKYLLASGGEVVRVYSIDPLKRASIWLNLDPALVNQEMSMEVLSPHPVLAERAQYGNVAGKPYGAGHGAAGSTPANEWTFAEGATGPLFDTFLLIGNPAQTSIAVEATYRLDSGINIVRHYVIPSRSRFTVWVDQEPGLAAVAFGIALRGLNNATFVAERSMWWPGTPGTWYEAHAAAGSTVRGHRWVGPSGEVAGTFPSATYVLVVNEDAVARRVRVQLLADEATLWAFDDTAPALCQPSQMVETYLVGPNSRFNIVPRTLYGNVGQQQCRFSAVYTAVDDYGVPVTGAKLIVEQVVYNDSGNPGSEWFDGGAAALATPWP